MKEWPCYGCGKPANVEDNYEPQGCCGGSDCGCMGKQINPVFCDECLKKYFEKP